MGSMGKRHYGAAIAAVLVFVIVQGQNHAAGVAAAPSGALLSNGGETASLNALIHYLYNIPAFRKAVYSSKESSDFVTELQRVFYQMQFNGCADTSRLAALEEWSFVETPGTADVSELRQVLLGNILGFQKLIIECFTEKGGWGTSFVLTVDSTAGIFVNENESIVDMSLQKKDTDIAPSISQTFGGMVENLIEAVAANFESTKQEFFLSVFLQVEGLDGVIASLKEQTSQELLEGENGIFVKEKGIVDGIRTSKFAELPPVLQLEFRRFTFGKEGVEKVNTPFAYPTELDFGGDNRGILTAAKSNDSGDAQRYRLQSVISHSGTPAGGTFRTFSSVPGVESEGWYRFDSEEIVAVKEADAVETLFGDGSDSENAYLVTYVRMSDWDEIHAPVKKANIPKEKRKLFKAEKPENGCSV